MEINRPRYGVEIITTGFHVKGLVEPVGPWLEFMNNRERHTLTVLNANASPLGGKNSHLPEHPQVYLSRHDVCAVILSDPAARAAMTILKHAEPAIAHVGPLICRCEFHMGAESHLNTFFDDLAGDFFVATHVELYVSATPSNPLPHRAEMMLINRRQVRLFYSA